MVEATRRVEAWHVGAFSAAPGGGNPAGVVLGAADLTEGQMGAVAHAIGASETAFVRAVHPAADGAGEAAASETVEVRFFTPLREVPVCGHATLAAHAVRAHVTGRCPGRALQVSPGARWPVAWEAARNGALARVTMVQAPVTWGRVVDGRDAADVYAAVGGRRPSVAPPPRIVSTGHAKVVVPVGSIAELRALRPDGEALESLSRRLGAEGWFVFALADGADDVLTECRMFAPTLGIPEDPVNGSGHGPLAAYLDRYGLLDGDAFESRMGIAAGRPGRVYVEVAREDGAVAGVRVGGDVARIGMLYLALEGDHVIAMDPA